MADRQEDTNKALQMGNAMEVARVSKLSQRPQDVCNLNKAVCHRLWCRTWHTGSVACTWAKGHTQDPGCSDNEPTVREVATPSPELMGICERLPLTAMKKFKIWVLLCQASAWAATLQDTRVDSASSSVPTFHHMESDGEWNAAEHPTEPDALTTVDPSDPRTSSVPSGSRHCLQRSRTSCHHPSRSRLSEGV